MTKEEILEMAKQSGLFCNELHCAPPMITWTGNENNLLNFANLVAKKEREECAKLIDNQDPCAYHVKGWFNILAKKIRARVQHD
jgi:hypothetical protein